MRRRVMRWTGCLLVVGAAQVRAQSVACHPASIDSAGMLRDVFRLADDSMRGRRVGTPEDAKARDFIAARFDALGLDRIAPGRIQPFAAGAGRGVTGYNVVGTVKGSRYPGEYIVVSAHFDHIGRVEPGSQCRTTSADSTCNGADDNASGTAGLLALARAALHSQPLHTIVFVAFDAEESGDVGSRAWVAQAPVPLDSVLMDINMDMVGRNVKQQLFIAGPDRFPALRPLAVATIGCTTGITLTIGHDGRGSGPGQDDWTDQSDQGAFVAKGIPYAYFGEEDHPDYHHVGDSADRLMPGFYAAAVRAVGDFIARADATPPARR